MKTSELTGVFLDWVVTKAEGLSHDFEGPTSIWGCHGWATSWEMGGPIIEREGINLRAICKEGHALDGQWLAAYDHGNTGSMVHWAKKHVGWQRQYLAGPTPLIAAMRCYVANQLGDEVDIPEQLMEVA